MILNYSHPGELFVYVFNSQFAKISEGTICMILSSSEWHNVPIINVITCDGIKSVFHYELKKLEQ
jgi:hypothetical protein